MNVSERPNEESALEWLNDCGWRGWLHDQLTGEMCNSYGDKWESPAKLQDWLQRLSPWPRARFRNVPRKDRP